MFIFVLFFLISNLCFLKPSLGGEKGERTLKILVNGVDYPILSPMQENENRYDRLATKINNPKVDDKELFQAFLEEYNLGTNLDTFHRDFKGKKSLAKILMEVTYSPHYNIICEAGLVSKIDCEEKSPKRFRHLGNELKRVEVPTKFKNVKIGKRIFKGSKLEERLKNPSIVNKSSEGCCMVQ